MERINKPFVSNQSSAVNDLLKERQIDYGDFGLGVAMEAKMMDLLNQIHFEHRDTNLSTLHESYFFRILIKLSRLGVSPEHLDSWKDIEGYALLIHKDIVERQNAESK